MHEASYNTCFEKVLAALRVHHVSRETHYARFIALQTFYFHTVFITIPQSMVRWSRLAIIIASIKILIIS